MKISEEMVVLEVLSFFALSMLTGKGAVMAAVAAKEATTTSKEGLPIATAVSLKEIDEANSKNQMHVSEVL